MELEKLEKERDAYVHNLFWLGLKIAAIFAVPAVLAALLGRYLDGMYSDGNVFTILCLVTAFVFSWAVVIRQFSKINKKIRTIESKIRDLKDKQNKATNNN